MRVSILLKLRSFDKLANHIKTTNRSKVAAYFNCRMERLLLMTTVDKFGLQCFNILLTIFSGREYGNKENLKEMGDVSSGMASTVIQIYLKAILESFINPEVVARHAAIKVISLILNQGLVHPVQIVPYLICVATDDEPKLSHTADRELQVS